MQSKRTGVAIKQNKQNLWSRQYQRAVSYCAFVVLSPEHWALTWTNTSLLTMVCHVSACSVVDGGDLEPDVADPTPDSPAPTAAHQPAGPHCLRLPYWRVTLAGLRVEKRLRGLLILSLIPRVSGVPSTVVLWFSLLSGWPDSLTRKAESYPTNPRTSPPGLFLFLFPWKDFTCND